MNVCIYCHTMTSTTEQQECNRLCQNCCEVAHLEEGEECLNTECVYIGCKAFPQTV